MYISDYSKLLSAMSRFYSYVQAKDLKTKGTAPTYLNFTDRNGFLGREEDYKYKDAFDAQNELQYTKWTPKLIGTGEIASRAIRAIGKAQYLVNFNQQVDFKNRLTPSHPLFNPRGEEVLYKIFCTDNIEDAFSDAMSVFGAKYDIMAFLCFVKDYEHFLPISTTNFDRACKNLGIDFKTTHRCNWDNYCKYISIMEEIHDLMEIVLPLHGNNARLIDAHSFMWIISKDIFNNWTPDTNTMSEIENRAKSWLYLLDEHSPHKRIQSTSAFCRSSQVVKHTKMRAQGICQLCKKPAPFSDKHGEPYLEVHHIIWLSRGGFDNINNTAALCPNCHAKMHIVDSIDDIEILQAEISK